MKNILTILVMFGTIAAKADETCKYLADYAGTYLLVSKTCDGPFGGDLTVEKYDSSHTPFMISSGGIGVGPAITSNSGDSCKKMNEVFVVQTCTNSPCLPQHWVYSFSGNQVTFSANGCQAVFAKE